MSSGAAEIAKSIVARELTCRQAVEFAIARIDAVDAETRAVACRRFEAALAEADEADRALVSGQSSVPARSQSACHSRETLRGDSGVPIDDVNTSA